MTIPFIAAHVSGVTLHQEDPSSAVPLSYIDTISSNLDTRIDALAGADEITWANLTAGTGFEAFEGTIQVSGQTGVSLDIKGYDTISSNAKYAHTEILASGTEYTNAYNWFVASAQKLSIVNASGNEYSAAYDWYSASAQKISEALGSGAEYTEAYDWYSASAQSISEILLDIAGSGAEYTAAYDWFTASAQKLSEQIASGSEYTQAYDWFAASAQLISEAVASGTEYSKAVASANALREGAFIEVKTGWSSVADGDDVTHGLGVLPTHVDITPSGAVTFGWAVDTLTTTQFKIHLTAAGSRMIGWRVEA